MCEFHKLVIRQAREDCKKEFEEARLGLEKAKREVREVILELEEAVNEAKQANEDNEKLIRKFAKYIGVSSDEAMRILSRTE